MRLPTIRVSPHHLSSVAELVEGQIGVESEKILLPEVDALAAWRRRLHTVPGRETGRASCQSPSMCACCSLMSHMGAPLLGSLVLASELHKHSTKSRRY